MGEVIAVCIVLGLLLLGMLVYTGLSKNKKADQLTRISIQVPRHDEARVLAELTALYSSRKPGFVEFYEQSQRIVRIVRD